MNSLFDIIQVPFGYLISLVYSLTNSYTVALIVFAIVVKVVLFPLGIKQQKNSQKQASLRPKEERIRKKYAGRTDRVTQQKMQQEILDLYQEEKFSPTAGCLPMILQLVVILCLYTVVRSPLTYVARLDKTQVTNVHTVITEMYKPTAPQQSGTTEKAPASSATGSSVAGSTAAATTTVAQNDSYYAEIQDIQKIHDDPEAFIKAYNAKYGAGEAEKFMDRLPELKLFGVIDLGVIPKEAGLISVPTIFALVSLLSAYLSQFLTRKFTYQPAMNADMNSQSSMKIMNFVMPLFSGYISYDMVPLAVTIYWIAQNLLSPVQQILLSKMYKIPTFTPEQLKEAEKALDKKESKKKDDSRPKRRSLVYDDDEDEAVAAPVTAAPKEKKVSGESPIEKAPLKEDQDKKEDEE